MRSNATMVPGPFGPLLSSHWGVWWRREGEMMATSMSTVELLELRNHDALYRTLVETSPDGIILAGLDGTIATANTRGARMMGYDDPEAVIGRNVFAAVAPRDRERAMTAMQQRASLEAPFGRNTEYRLNRPDGTGMSVEVNSSVVLDDNDRPFAVLIIARDVTERKRAERSLRESEESFRVLFAGNPQPMWVYDAESLQI